MPFGRTLAHKTYLLKKYSRVKKTFTRYIWPFEFLPRSRYQMLKNVLEVSTYSELYIGFLGLYNQRLLHMYNIFRREI